MKKIIISLLLCIALGRSFGQLSNKITAEEKVYGLSKFWQEANYNFVYLNKIDRTQWDSTYKALIGRVQRTTSDYEYYRELQKFCALLNDGHTNVYLPKDIQIFNSMFGNKRLFIDNIDGKAIIVRTNLSQKDSIPLGSEVISVNGLPVKEYMSKNVTPYISASTDYIKEDWSARNLLQGLSADQYDLQFRKPNGETNTIHLTHKISEEKELYPQAEHTELFELKWLENDIAYIALNSFENPRIDSLFYQALPELYKAKGLIVDLRYNGGGDTWVGTSILKYLTNDNTLYGAKQVTRSHIAAYKAWGKNIEPKDTLNNEFARKAYLNFHDQDLYVFDFPPLKVRVSTKRLVVPTVLLTGHNTASSAEDFLIHADNQKHMIRIGENTFGSTGQPMSFELPGGGSARICTKQDLFPDGREFVGYGIKPHIEVKRTVADFISKRDAALEKAVEYLNKELHK